MQPGLSRQMLLALPRDASSHRQRVRLMRFRNWSDPADVMPDEAYTLRQLRGLPECQEQEDTLTKLFGSVAAYLDAWKAYVAWGDPAEIAEAEALHRQPLGARWR